MVCVLDGNAANGHHSTRLVRSHQRIAQRAPALEAHDTEYAQQSLSDVNQRVHCLKQSRCTRNFDTRAP